MSIEELTPTKPASAEAVIELLRGQLEAAYKQRVEYLEITVKFAGRDRPDSISITTSALPRT